MLTLEQIPEPVWRRVQEFTGRTDEHFCKCLAAEVVAAWPGAFLWTFSGPLDGTGYVIPLSTEKSDD